MRMKPLYVVSLQRLGQPQARYPQRAFVTESPRVWRWIVRVFRAALALARTNITAVGWCERFTV